MKIIDLLNKIAKGEEVPKEIEHNGDLYLWEKNDKTYYSEPNGADLMAYIDIPSELNDEVEIIEEEKEIEKIDFTFDNTIWETEYQTANDIEQKLINQNAILKQKVDNLIDVINDMRDKEC